MLPGGIRLPFEHALGGLFEIERLLLGEDADLVDPTREVRRGGHVRRKRHDPRAGVLEIGQPRQGPPERFLSRRGLGIARVEFLRNGDCQTSVVDVGVEAQSIRSLSAEFARI